MRVMSPAMLSGEVYTARDVAHRRLYESLLKGEKAAHRFVAGGFVFTRRRHPHRRKSYRLHRSHHQLPDGFLHAEINRKRPSGNDRQGQPFAGSCRSHQKVQICLFRSDRRDCRFNVSMRQKSKWLPMKTSVPEAIRKLTVRDFPLVVVNDSSC